MGKKQSLKNLPVSELNEQLKQNSAEWSLDPELLKGVDLEALRKEYRTGCQKERRGTLQALNPRMRPKAAAMPRMAMPLMAMQRAPMAPLPRSCDWRNMNGKNYVSDVKNQGGCGSCVAFAVAAAMESHYRIERRKDYSQEPIDLSEASLFFPAGCKCSIGWRPEKGLKAAIDEGVCLESSYPYRPVDQKAKILEGNTRVLKIQGYDSTTSTSQMKRWLFMDGPLVGCFDVYEDFRLFFAAAKDGVYTHSSGRREGSHAVCVIGYDDEKEAWLCKNSWGGSRAHPDGCFWIKYGECKIDARMWIPQDVYNKYTIDNVAYNPRKLVIRREEDGKYLLTDGGTFNKRFASHEDAVNGMRVAMRHTQQCFVGRNNKRTNKKDYIFEYWSGTSGVPYYPVTRNDVTEYDPDNVVAEHLGSKGWAIREGDNTLFLADDMDDAMAILAVYERFRRIGYIGRDNEEENSSDYIMRYFE